MNCINFGLNLHHRTYELSSWRDYASFITLTCATYASRHWQLSNEVTATCSGRYPCMGAIRLDKDDYPLNEDVMNLNPTSWKEHAVIWGHRIIAVLEFTPVLGLLIGLIERVIARYLQSSYQKTLSTKLGPPPHGKIWDYATIYKELQLCHFHSTAHHRSSPSNNDAWSIMYENTAILRVIKCLKENKVSLDLSNLALTSVSEKALASLVNLERLYCHCNSINTLNIYNLTKLKRLTCCYGALESLTLSNLPVLEVVNCCDNKLSSINLSGLSSLQRLNCSYNLEQFSSERDGMSFQATLTPRTGTLRPLIWQSIAHLPRSCSVFLSECRILHTERERLAQLTLNAGPKLFFIE